MSLASIYKHNWITKQAFHHKVQALLNVLFNFIHENAELFGENDVFNPDNHYWNFGIQLFFSRINKMAEDLRAADIISLDEYTKFNADLNHYTATLACHEVGASEDHALILRRDAIADVAAQLSVHFNQFDKQLKEHVSINQKELGQGTFTSQMIMESLGFLLQQDSVPVDWLTAVLDAMLNAAIIEETAEVKTAIQIVHLFKILQIPLTQFSKLSDMLNNILQCLRTSTPVSTCINAIDLTSILMLLKGEKNMPFYASLTHKDNFIQFVEQTFVHWNSTRLLDILSNSTVNFTPQLTK